MPAKVTRLTDVPPDIAAMHWTHEMARELGAPDLAESKTFGRDLKSGTEPESTLTRSTALARGLAKQALARQSLQRRPVDGFFVRCGHEKTEANIYRDPKGERCRVCRNAHRREMRRAA